MSTGQSQQLIQKLLKAEEEAEALIAKARENRVRKLREAKQAADDEMAIFRRKEEEKFQTEQSAVTGGADGDATSLEAQTLTDLKRVQSDFNGNKDKITEYMVEKILTVKPELSQIQVALLQAATA
jgi:V-type H+-transporting ATPase subunit G